VLIAREIEGQTKREVKLGSVYATLERLQEKGFVVSELGEPTYATLPRTRF
jgi:DNA-binding PadR family transcriptional regulator